MAARGVDPQAMRGVFSARISPAGVTAGRSPAAPRAPARGGAANACQAMGRSGLQRRAAEPCERSTKSDAVGDSITSAKTVDSADSADSARRSRALPLLSSPGIPAAEALRLWTFPAQTRMKSRKTPKRGGCPAFSTLLCVRLEARMGSSCSSLLKRGASVSEPEGDFLGAYGAVLMSASAER